MNERIYNEKLMHAFKVANEKNVDKKKIKDILYILSKLYTDYEIQFQDTVDKFAMASCGYLDDDDVFGIQMNFDHNTFISEVAVTFVPVERMIEIIDHYYDSPITIIKTIKLGEH